MASFHIKMTAQKQMTLSKLENHLRSNSNAEFLSRAEYQFGDSHVLLLVFEEYYYRASGTISLTVLLIEHTDNQTAEIIASGGGEGTNFSFGACRSFAKSCMKVLENCGFAGSDPEPEKKLTKRVLEYFID